MRAVTDSAQDAILIMDPLGRVSYWNPAAERMLGYRAEEALGKNLHSLLAPERYHAEQQAAFPEFVRSGRGQALGKTLDLFARRQDGREIPISLSLSAVSLKGAWHAVGIIQDITERKQVEERLRESRKMEAIAHLTGGMAHQFNNILAVLVTGLDLAQTLNPGAEARAVLHQMQGQAHRAADLIKQLLAFSRQSMLRRQPLDLAALVARQGNQLAPFLGARITVRWHSPSGLAWVNADQEAMEQVVLNLCLNARNAMPDGGLLRLTLAEVEVGAEQAKAHDTAQPGRHVCLSVADTGCGMDDRTLKRLFEPFFTTQDVGKGTGLGLAEVRGIVNQHHGWLEVDSRVGKGSTFRVYLPAVAPPPPDPASPPPTG
jgi:PAS domain S-box-containing protein